MGKTSENQLNGIENGVPTAAFDLSPEDIKAAARSRSVKSVRGYLPTLDGWRAVAILMVIAYHGIASLQRVYGQKIDFLLPILHVGSVGVLLFFSISGVLITCRMLEEQSFRGQIDLGKFYVRRAFRILPPLLALLVVLSLLSAFGILPVTWPDRIRALFFASNYGPQPDWYLAHTWSLSVEEHFYLFWPVVLILLGWSRSIVFCLCAAITVTLWRIADIHFSIVPPYIGYTAWRTDTNLDFLLLAAAVGCLMGREAAKLHLQKLLTPAVTLGLLAIGLTVLILQAYVSHLQYPLRIFEAMVLPLMLIGTILNPRQLVGRVLEWGWLRWVGRLSYSLYLWQQLFFPRADARCLSLGSLQDWPFNLLAALVCAAASFYLIEKPLIKLGHRLARPVTEGH